MYWGSYYSKQERLLAQKVLLLDSVCSVEEVVVARIHLPFVIFYDVARERMDISAMKNEVDVASAMFWAAKIVESGLRCIPVVHVFVHLGPSFLRVDVDDWGAAGVGIEISAQDLREGVVVLGTFADDNLHLLAACRIALVIEVGVEDAQVAARLAVAEAHPVAVAGSVCAP